MLIQSAIHFALDYLIQTVCRYFEVSISSNKVWGIFVFHDPLHFSGLMSYVLANSRELQISANGPSIISVLIRFAS